MEITVQIEAITTTKYGLLVTVDGKLIKNFEDARTMVANGNQVQRMAEKMVKSQLNKYFGR